MGEEYFCNSWFMSVMFMKFLFGRISTFKSSKLNGPYVSVEVLANNSLDSMFKLSFRFVIDFILFFPHFTPPQYFSYSCFNVVNIKEFIIFLYVPVTPTCPLCMWMYLINLLLCSSLILFVYLIFFSVTIFFKILQIFFIFV